MSPLLISKECDEHGPFNAWSAGNYSTLCPKCVRLKKEMPRSGIPPRYFDKTLENYNAENDGQKRALAVAREWQGENLLFFGAVGTGKTHLGIALARAIIEEGGTAIYARAAQITAEIKETWGTNKPERIVFEKYAEPDLLILDEIGRQRATDTERLALFEVIHRRYEQQKPIIAISNLDGEKLREYLGDAAIDRLRENGRAVLFDWKSCRFKI